MRAALPVLLCAVVCPWAGAADTLFFDDFDSGFSAWATQGEVSANSVTVNVTSLKVEQLMEQRIRLVLEAEMTTEIDGKIRLFRIHQEGPDMHIDGWLEHDGRVIRTAVNRELEDLTRTVVTTLARAS